MCFIIEVTTDTITIASFCFKLVAKDLVIVFTKDCFLMFMISFQTYYY